MKWISDVELETMSSLLHRRQMGNCTLDGRISLFSFAPEDLMDSSVPLGEPVDGNLADSGGGIDEASVFAAAEAYGSGSAQGNRPRSLSTDSTNSSSSAHFARTVRKAKSRSGSLSDLGATVGTALLRCCQGAMNVTFPNHDFGVTHADQFIDEGDSSHVIHKINSMLSELSADNEDFLMDMWRCLDSSMDISKCDAYSYQPPPNEDPFTPSKLWSFHYFFLSREKERILYFTCVGQNTALRGHSNPYTNDDDDGASDGASMSDGDTSSNDGGFGSSREVDLDDT